MWWGAGECLPAGAAGRKLERGLTLWGEGVIVISRCCSFHKNTPKTMIKQLPPQKYAALLCETVDKYSYPAVTYDFSNCSINQNRQQYNKVNTFQKNCENPHKNNACSNNQMYNVEKYIGDLLHSNKRKDVINGLLNVLYWGYFKYKGRAYNNINKFRKNIDRKKLHEFIQLVKQIKTSKNNIGTISTEQFILKIEIPQFRMSFTSKILMFLDPKFYPVLDAKIANYIMNLCSSPLQGLKFPSTIEINKKNACVYESWACWCREIADEVNKIPDSPRDDIRAVDVERALFSLANSNKISANLAAESLLAGPSNFNIKCP